MTPMDMLRKCRDRFKELAEQETDEAIKSRHYDMIAQIDRTLANWE